MPISTHEISLHGFSGAIFWCVLSALIFYVLGFATVSWESRDSYSVGLWATCSSSSNAYNADWFRATQAMITIGLILLIACAVAMFIYMFVHSLSISKNTVIIVFVSLILFAVVFMLIGFIIFGVNHNRGDLNWSYAFAVIGGILSLIAGILGLVQMKQSNVF